MIGVFSNPGAEYDVQACRQAPPLASDPEAMEEDAPTQVPTAPEPAGGWRRALLVGAGGDGGTKKGDAAPGVTTLKILEPKNTNF